MPQGGIKHTFHRCRRRQDLSRLTIIWCRCNQVLAVEGGAGPCGASRSEAASSRDRGDRGRLLCYAKAHYHASPEQRAADLRDKLILRLKKCPGIEVVGSSSEADAILTGTGETWLNGYINSSPKPSPCSRQPVYDGYLSVELHGKTAGADLVLSTSPSLNTRTNRKETAH
jgi:hypothetical protein